MVAASSTAWKRGAILKRLLKRFLNSLPRGLPSGRSIVLHPAKDPDIYFLDELARQDEALVSKDLDDDVIWNNHLFKVGNPPVFYFYLTGNYIILYYFLFQCWWVNHSAVKIWKNNPRVLHLWIIPFWCCCSSLIHGFKMELFKFSFKMSFQSWWVNNSGR